MKVGEFLKKTAAAVSVPVRTALAERSATAQYEKEMAIWNAKRTAAIAAIRVKLNQPFWLPKSLHIWAPGLGPPPINPNANVTIPTQHDLDQFDQE